MSFSEIQYCEQDSGFYQLETLCNGKFGFRFITAIEAECFSDAISYWTSSLNCINNKMNSQTAGIYITIIYFYF